MSVVTAPNGAEQRLRAIVFKEGENFVAQCLDYDIAVQSDDLESLVQRLELAIEAEFAVCAEDGVEPKDCIVPAPNYYHQLWEQQSFKLDRVSVPAPGMMAIDTAFAKAA